MVKLNKKAMQVGDNHYLSGVNFHKNTTPMHDLKRNFDKILPIVNTTFADQLDRQGNVQSYPRKPAMGDAHIMALALLQEALSIDSERWFWSKLQSDYYADFPNLPHRSNYNRRRKRLAGPIEKLARRWARHLCPDEDTFMVDSIPVPVAHIAREHTTSVCRERFYSAPDKGYSAITDQYYIGYKLHLVVSLDGVYQCMDLTKASVHDVHYLKDLKPVGSATVCCWLTKDTFRLPSKSTCFTAPASIFKRRCGVIKSNIGRGQRSLKPHVGVLKPSFPSFAGR